MRFPYEVLVRERCEGYGVGQMRIQTFNVNRKNSPTAPRCLNDTGVTGFAHCRSAHPFKNQSGAGRRQFMNLWVG